MRHLVLASALLLVACGDSQNAQQSSSGDNSPNLVAGRDATVNQNVQLSKEAEARLVQGLIEKGVPASELTQELEELKRKYADLEQRLGGYAKTDELAQQARKALDIGDLDQAATLLQQAYDKDWELSRQRLAQRAFDLAEVAELRFEHEKALARYQEVTQLQVDHITAWWNLAELAKKLGKNKQALDAWQGMQKAAQMQQQERELAAALLGKADSLKILGENKTAQDNYLQAHKLLVELQQVEPNNVEKQRDLSVSYDRLGAIYEANGDRGAALKAYQDSLAIRNKLVEMDINNVQWQTDMVVSYVRLAGVELSKKRDYLNKALIILENLNAENRLSAEQQNWIDFIKIELKN